MTSNVDNLKKKLEEANATTQAAKSAMDKKIAENFDIEEKIANLKKEADNARKSAEEVKSKAKREEQAAKDKVTNLETQLAVSQKVVNHSWGLTEYSDVKRIATIAAAGASRGSKECSQNG